VNVGDNKVAVAGQPSDDDGIDGKDGKVVLAELC
jgi:hypothetical protein